jgi:hypothetical protein
MYPLEMFESKRTYVCSYTGLPNGIVRSQKSLFGYVFKCLGMENVGILYGCLNLVRTFVICNCHLVHFVVIFSCLGILYQEKSGNPVRMYGVNHNVITCVRF